ncbi:DUF2637 domain-containing protein [Streptomyces sp. NPDC051662]|uniref:DUF2637 domain-containing protein n=1 Tax=Streptomyces sp. NPDC051662 TaxID=3154750 RepID=UPI00343CDB29
MTDTLTGDQHAAYRGAMAGAAPDAAGAAPDGRPGAPGVSGSVPPAPRKGGRTRPGVADSPVSTAPADGDADQADGRGTRWLAVAALIGMIPVAIIGFAASYTTVADKAAEAGFAGWLAPWIPIGLDGAIIGFLAMDLYMTRRRTPWPLLRFAAHAMTAATVVINAAAGGAVAVATEGDAAAEALPASVRVFWHGLMPVLFVVGVEGARRLIVHAVELEDGTAIDRIPLHRWALSPLKTPRLYREMRLSNITSYPEMVKRKQALEGYKVWLKQSLGGDLSEASDAQMLPMTMAPQGYSVEEALRLPAKWNADAAERDREETERLRREAEREREQAKADRIAAIRDEGDIVEVEHQTAARTGTAAAEAESTRTRAELQRLTTERLARTETEAMESEEAAAARRRAADDDEKAAATELRAARIREDATRKAEEAERRQQETERAAARRITENNRLAREAEETAKAELRTARLREETSRIEAAAEAAEDYARLGQRQRNARRVARMLLVAHPEGTPADKIDLEKVPLAAVQDRLSVGKSVAGELRQEGLALIGSGYTIRAAIEAAFEPQG